MMSEKLKTIKEQKRIEEQEKPRKWWDYGENR